MRSWTTVVVRRTCAMFGDRYCYSVLHRPHYHHHHPHQHYDYHHEHHHHHRHRQHHHHHQLLPMELITVIYATIIILITIISDISQVEAIQFTKSFQSTTFSTVITSGQNERNDNFYAKKRLRQNASNYLMERLNDFMALPKYVPTHLSRLTNRQDCNGSDCLRNNNAVSLYIPRKNNTSRREQPSFLLLSNNPSSSSRDGKRKMHQPSESERATTLKFSNLHTGIKILEPISTSKQHAEKSLPDNSYHISSVVNLRNHGEYSGSKSSETGSIPPFAGGAELTDFIQPIDTTVTNTHRLYENLFSNIISHVAPVAHYGKNKHYHLLSTGNRDTIYGNQQSVPLIPLNRKSQIYEPITSLPQAGDEHAIYSTYSYQNTDHFTLSLSPSSSSSSTPNYDSKFQSHLVSLSFPV
uniref:Uncharacterized protein n=1 Tax=Setaria digitata TaxID=48799 RepID=A0A915PEI3_9BILA